jgi:hypothetical protein
VAQKLRVISRKPTLLDFGLVERGISEHSGKTVSRERAFVHYIVATIFGIDPSDCGEHIVDGGGDRGIDIIYIDHQNRQVNIGSCKTVASYKNSLRSFPGKEIDKVISFMDDLMHHRESIFEGANGALTTKIREIWEIFSTDPYEIKIHLFSNQLTLNEVEKSRLQTSLVRHRADLYEHGLYEIAHGVVRATRPKFRKQISPVAEQFFTVRENGHRGFATRITLKELHAFLAFPESTKFDERLLDQNVRYFLTLDNAVNQEIKNTLITGNPHDFWFLNNGLTIVADQVITIENGCHPITLVNPQIVNGAQTAKVVFHVGAETLSGLSDGTISIKLIESSNRAFIEKIAIASNTQSRIFGRDLRANDHIQTELASAINSYGYFYKRKRGQEVPKGVIGTIDSARAGQLLLAYVHGDPVKSKTNSNDIFEDLYPQTFDPNVVTAEMVISAHRIHQQVDVVRQKAVAWQNSVTRRAFSESWLIEGHLHVMFAVGELMRRRGIPLDNSDRGIDLIDEAISIVDRLVRQNDKVAAYRLFRSTRTKEGLLQVMDGLAEPSDSRPKQLLLGI